MEANSSQFFPLGNREGLYIWSGLFSSPLPIPLLKLRYVGQRMFLNTRSINVFIFLLSWELIWALVMCVWGLADLFEVIFYSAFTQMCILLKSGPLLLEAQLTPFRCWCSRQGIKEIHVQKNPQTSELWNLKENWNSWDWISILFLDIWQSGEGMNKK